MLSKHCGFQPRKKRKATDAESNQTAQFLLEMKREAEHLLETRIRFLKHRSSVTTSIREGVPATEILSEADQGDYDLVVVGATGATDMKHSVLGSVSSKVAWNALLSFDRSRSGVDSPLGT
jgi:nucleotide-binding universal stress UspA family protein